jgi:hypothetical protein
MARTIKGETKKDGQKKGRKTHNSHDQKTKNLSLSLSLSVGNYFTHDPSNVTRMQIMSMGGLKQAIFYPITKAKAH